MRFGDCQRTECASTIWGHCLCGGGHGMTTPALTSDGFSFPLGQSVALPYFQAQPNLTSTWRSYEQVHKARHKLISSLQLLSTAREKYPLYFPSGNTLNPKMRLTQRCPLIIWAKCPEINGNSVYQQGKGSCLET